MPIKPTLYLDTSIPNVLHDTRDPKIQKVTEQFWKILGDYHVFISQIVIDEISETRNPTRRELLQQSILSFSILEVKEEVEYLVKEYSKHKLVPAEDINDAYHVAVATIYELDYLVTWNLEHLAKELTRKKVMAINVLQGYEPVKIVTPYDLLP